MQNVLKPMLYIAEGLNNPDIIAEKDLFKF